MKQFALTLCVCLGVVALNSANGQETSGSPQAQAGDARDLAEQLKEKPDDKSLFDKYMIANLGELQGLMRTDLEKAEKKIAEMKQVIDSLEPTTDIGKQLVVRAGQAFNYYGQQVELARMTLEQIVTELKANPNDTKAISLYQSKLTAEVSPLTRTDPEKAEQILTAAKEVLTSIKESAEEDAAKTAIERLERLFGSLEQRIETGRRLIALIGADAAPLEIETWVNGEPLTDGDLKGKVVLLDFWSVWCGPCIATFPHLREWNEKYADEGLIIIGMTRYYNYTWDEETGRAKRAPRGEEVEPEQEQEMLAKFAEHHDLGHHFAIQKDDELSKYYAVTGIPHVVVIDREGKVRLIRVGSGEQNAKDVSEMLEKLIANG